jgi:hypothetical protein
MPPDSRCSRPSSSAPGTCRCDPSLLHSRRRPAHRVPSPEPAAVLARRRPSAPSAPTSPTPATRHSTAPNKGSGIAPAGRCRTYYPGNSETDRRRRTPAAGCHTNGAAASARHWRRRRISYQAAERLTRHGRPTGRAAGPPEDRLRPAIHVCAALAKSWVAGPSPAMTGKVNRSAAWYHLRHAMPPWISKL